jgi:N-acetylglucosamine kinase-like BadF-type ATPase
MPLFLAIDAGGTKTACLLAADDRVLARASTGTVKLMRVSEAEATTRLQTMLTEVSASAGVSLSDITRTCLGLAGLSTAHAREWAQRTIPALVAGDLLLCGDEEIALDAAFRGRQGILVVAGTGSNAIGRAPDGRLFAAGGWGPVLGDEGSGTWIGLEAIRAALRANDQAIPASEDISANQLLLREIEQHWGLHSLSELIALSNHRGDATRPAPDFASLAPIVARCAQQGDPIAATVLERAGAELAELVALVWRKMRAGKTEVADASQAEVSVAFTGSILSHIAPVRAAMVARLATLVPAAGVHNQPVDPLDGALWRARHPR